MQRAPAGRDAIVVRRPGRPSPWTRRRLPRSAALLNAIFLVVLTLLAGCALPVRGRGTLIAAPDAHLSVHGDSGGAFDQQVKNAIADVEAFWRRTYPQISSGTPLPPLKGGLWSVDGDAFIRTGKVPPDVAGEACLRRRPSFIVDNAAYCRIDDSIIWDRSPDHLVPVLARSYGPVLTALVFAHEFGHAIQQRTGTARGTHSTIDLESQADCAAGAFMAAALQGQAPHFPLTRADLNRALDGYLLIRDSTPESPDDISHGNGFDRLNALQQGITHGARYCYAPGYFARQHFTERGFVSDADLLSGGNLPLREMLRQNVLAKDLNRFWSKAATAAGKQWQPLRLQVGQAPCSLAALAYCDTKTTVYISSGFARQAYFSISALAIARHTADVQLQEHEPGDFALGAMLSIAWGMAAREQLDGASTSGQSALLAAVCAAGAYAADINLPKLPANDKQHPFVLSPPDMDEASSAVLNLVPLRQAFGARGTDGLQRIENFVRGYNGGLSACS